MNFVRLCSNDTMSSSFKVRWKNTVTDAFVERKKDRLDPFDGRKVFLRRGREDDLACGVGFCSDCQPVNPCTFPSNVRQRVVVFSELIVRFEGHSKDGNRTMVVKVGFLQRDEFATVSTGINLPGP